MAVSHTKPRVWIKAAVAAAAICLLIFGSVRYYNAQMEAEIKEILNQVKDQASITYDDLEVSVVGRSLTVRNIAIQSGGMKYTAQELILEGLHSDAFKGVSDKPIVLLKRLVSRNFVQTTPENVTSGDEVVMENISGTTSLLNLFMQDTGNAETLKALEGLSIGSTRAKNLSVFTPKENITQKMAFVSSKESRGVSFIKDFALEGISVLLDTHEVATIAAIKGDEINLPNLGAVIAAATVEDDEALLEAFSNTLASPDARVAGMRIEGIKVFPNPQDKAETASVDLVKMDFAPGADQVFSLGMDHWKFGKALLADAAGISGSKTLPEELDVSALVKMVFSPEKGLLNYESIKIGEAKLGSAELSMLLSGVHKFAFSPSMADIMKTAINSAALTMQDTGMVNVFFEVSAAAQQASADDLRTMSLAQLEMLKASTQDETVKGLIASVAGFLTNSGTLTVAVKPVEPIRPLSGAVNPEKLGLSFSHTPARQ